MTQPFHFEVIPLSEAPIEVSTPNPTQPPVVMVVDDEVLIADSLAAILAHTGFSILKAYDGLSALTLAERFQPDLLITDVAMPGMDGIELAMTMASEFPGCKVLLFSAHASALDLGPAQRAGHNFPLITKPIHPKDMLARVTACFEGRSAQAN